MGACPLGFKRAMTTALPALRKSHSRGAGPDSAGSGGEGPGSPVSFSYTSPQNQSAPCDTPGDYLAPAHQDKHPINKTSG